MIDAAGLNGRTARLAFLRVAACVMAIIVGRGGGRGQTSAQAAGLPAQRKLESAPSRTLPRSCWYLSTSLETPGGASLRAASDGWSDATVLLDSMGDRRSQRERQRRLRDEVVALRGPGALKRLATARSHSQRLLQLADYVAGIVMRQRTGKKWGDDYFAGIEGRGTVQRLQ